MAPSIQNIGPAFSGLLGAIAWSNHKWGEGGLQKFWPPQGTLQYSPVLIWPKGSGPTQTISKSRLDCCKQIRYTSGAKHTTHKTQRWMIQTHTHAIVHSAWFSLFGLSLNLSLRQLLVSHKIYTRWNNLCTHLSLMFRAIPAASVISCCSYWYAPCPVQCVGG